MSLAGKKPKYSHQKVLQLWPNRGTSPRAECRGAMLVTHVAPWVSPLCATSVRVRRTERHSAWKHPGGPDGWCRGKHEKVPRWVTRSSSSDGVVPTSTERASDSWENRNHEEWRVYVRSLTGTTRRAALMATVGGLCVGPVLASDEEASTSLDDTFLSDSPSRDLSYPTVTAESNDPTQTDPNEDNPWEGSYVKPAMTVPQYIEEVRVTMPDCNTLFGSGYVPPTPKS